MPDVVERLDEAERDGAGWAGRFAALRACEGTGRPLGNADFVAGLERLLGRPLARRAPGRKARLLTEEDRQPVLL